jgi:hypothetical protein
MLFSLSLVFIGASVFNVKADLKDQINGMFDSLGNDPETLDMKNSTQNLLAILDNIARLDIDAVLEQDGAQVYKLTDAMNDIVESIKDLDDEARKIILPIAQLKIAYARVIKQLGEDQFKDDLVAKLRSQDNYLFNINYFKNTVTQFFATLDNSIKTLGNDENSVENHISIVIETCVEKLNSLIVPVRNGVIASLKNIQDRDTYFLVTRGKVFSVGEQQLTLSELIRKIQNLFKEQLIADLNNAVTSAIKAIQKLPKKRRGELRAQHDQLLNAINRPVGGALVDGILGAVDAPAQGNGNLYF